MSTKYICKRCNYKCSIQTDIIKHMKKKNICHKSLEAYSYSEDQLSVLSLLPYVNNINIVNNDEIEYLKDLARETADQVSLTKKEKN